MVKISKLKKQEEKFAISHITDYYSYDGDCKYSELIDFTLDKFEKNIFDFNYLSGDNHLENVIVKKLLQVFKENLQYEKENNKTGLFGVKPALFPDGTKWYYKNLIKNEFVKTSPIYAHDLDELKIKVGKNKGIWLIFNHKLFAKSQERDDLLSLNKSRVKRKRKKEFPKKSIDEIMEKNSRSESFLEMKKEEKEKTKKANEIDSLLDDSFHNNYKKDIHKFFR